MAKLIVKFNNEVVDTVELKQGDTTIGRRPGSDIQLDNLAVSGFHANVFSIADDSFVQDMNSTNGTFVNNRRITKHHLKNGDMIVIGKHTLIYVADTTEKPAEDFAKTVIINPQRPDELQIEETNEAYTGPGAKEAGVADAASTPASPMKAAIFVLSGANSGKRIDLTRPVTNFGRAGRRSGVIARNRTGAFTLFPGADGEPPRLNGSTVNLRGNELKDGDIIEIAGSRMQFYLK